MTRGELTDYRSASNGVLLIGEEPQARAFSPSGDETHTFTLVPVSEESELRVPDGAAASGEEFADRHTWTGVFGPCLGLSYPQLGSAVVELTGPSSATVRHRSVPSLSRLDWEHVLLSSVVPQTLGLFGELVLHACAIDVRSSVPGDHLGVVLLAGPSMAGKSTIANAALDLGHRLLSDDGVRMIRNPDEPGGWLCFPGLAGARRRVTGPDGTLRRVVVGLDEGPVPIAPRPVRAVVLLGTRTDDLTITPCSTAAAVRAISGHRMTHVPGFVGPGLAASLVGLASGRSFVARFPDDLDRVHDSLGTVLATVLSSDAASASFEPQM